MSWKFKSCGAGFNINIGDRVWLDVAHVLYDTFRVCENLIEYYYNLLKQQNIGKLLVRLYDVRTNKSNRPRGL